MRGFIDALTASPLVLDAWDEQLLMPVAKGVVGKDGSIELVFKNGERVTIGVS
jgi:hypothetical protein